MLLVTCPHCQITIEVIQLNCAIFRCGTFKTTGEQVPPHTPKSECDRLTEENRIWGCGKPFKVVSTPEGHRAESCDYI